MKVVRWTAPALLVLLVAACGRDESRPANIPIVVNDGALADGIATTDAATAPLLETPLAVETLPAVLPSVVPPRETDAPATISTIQPTAAAPPEPLVTPTRTLTETVEELLGTTVAETTTAITSTETVRATVGNLSVTVLGVRGVPLNADLTSSSDEHVVVVHVVLQNTSNEAVLFQSATDIALRDEAGNTYVTSLVARASAEAQEPDLLVPIGGSVEGEIAYQVPDRATSFQLIVRNSGREATLSLPGVSFTPSEKGGTAIPEGTPSTLPSAVEGT